MRAERKSETLKPKSIETDKLKEKNSL